MKGITDIHWDIDMYALALGITDIHWDIDMYALAVSLAAATS